MKKSAAVAAVRYMCTHDLHSRNGLLGYLRVKGFEIEPWMENIMPVRAIAEDEDLLAFILTAQKRKEGEGNPPPDLIDMLENEAATNDYADSQLLYKAVEEIYRLRGRMQDLFLMLPEETVRKFNEKM